MTNRYRSAVAALALAFAGCGGGSPSSAPSLPSTAPAPNPNPTAVASATPTPAPTPAAAPMNAHLVVAGGASGFSGATVAQLPENVDPPRDLAALPNGDLIVGTGSATSGQSNVVMIVPGADTTGSPGTPSVFATMPNLSCDHSLGPTGTANGVAFSAISSAIYVGTECAVWKIPYRTGDRIASAAPQLLFKVRTGLVTDFANDGDVHHTTSLVTSGNALYVGVGSSCNACAETDATRAVVLRSDLSGGGITTVATRFRNALALATNPQTGTVWAGGAGQDCMVPTFSLTCAPQNDAYAANGHPFEFIDPVTLHQAPADYGWPGCEENHTVVIAGSNCTNVVVGAVRAPAYSTIIGATFYAPAAGARYAFPPSYSGGLFIAMHGSWHEGQTQMFPVAQPAVAFIPMNGDAPQIPMDWTIADPTSQWQQPAFVSGFQAMSTRYGRPVGLAVGPLGSLFVADDFTGAIYRIRYGT